MRVFCTRAIDERTKPNTERMPIFRESGKESLELELFSTEPIYDDFEILNLTDSLTDFAEQFGADEPLVKQALAGKSPHARAVELVSGTKLKDVGLRKKLYAGDAAGLAAAHDPMLDLARLIEAPALELRKARDAQEEIKQQAYGEIAKARFAIEGTGSYPDATFTLRLSYGTVRGYEQDGKQIPAFTDFAGLYRRSAEHDNKSPFDLPQRWIDKKADVNLATHLDFVSDADIIGGNSGSPVVNKSNEFVGIIFDGNIQSLVLDCIYTDTQARAVSVDSAAITEALRNVYNASALVDELEGVRGRDAARAASGQRSALSLPGLGDETGWPILDSLYKTGSHRIRENVISLFAKALLFAQTMFEKIALPIDLQTFGSPFLPFTKTGAPALTPRETK